MTLLVSPVGRQTTPTLPQDHRDPPPGVQGGRPPTDSRTGETSTLVKRPVNPGDTVYGIIASNPVPMTLEEFYAFNPQVDRKREDGKIDIPKVAEDPDGLAAKEQFVWVKGPANDSLGAATQRKVADAQTADKAVTDLERSGGSKEMIQERKDYAALKWKEAGEAVGYELRINPGADRRARVEGYAPGNEKYKKGVDDTFKTVQGQTAAERNTDIKVYEVKLAKVAVTDAAQGGNRNMGELQAAQRDLTTKQAELDKALNDEFQDRIQRRGTGASYEPNLYGTVTKQMSERFTDPTVRNQIQAIAIAKEVEGIKGLGPQDQLTRLEKLTLGKPPEVVAAVYGDARVLKLLGGAVADAYERGGAPEAARVLRDLAVTAQSPIVAGKIVQASMPTIEKIVNDLGLVAKSGKADPKGIKAPINDAKFIDIVSDLSTTIEQVAPFEDKAAVKANQPIVDDVAKLFADKISNKIDVFRHKFGTALHGSIEHGAGVALASSIADYLNRTGKADAADGIVKTMDEAVQDLIPTAAKAWTDWIEAHSQALYLQSGYGGFTVDGDEAQEQKLDAFWEKFKAEHPEMAATDLELNRYAIAIARTYGSIRDNADKLQGLPSANGLFKSVGELVKNEESINAISNSQEAMYILGMDQASGGGEHSVVAQLSYANLPVMLRTAIFRGANVYTAAVMQRASTAMMAGDSATFAAEISKLRDNARFLGYSGDRLKSFNHLIDTFAKVNVAGLSARTLGLAPTSAEYKDAVDQLVKEYKGIVQEEARVAAGKKPLNGPSFHPTTGPGLLMRLAGVVLVLPIAYEQNLGPNRVWTDGNPLAIDHLGATAQTAFFDAFAAHQLRFSYLGIASNKANLAGAPLLAESYREKAAAWSHLSEPLSIASAAVEIALAVSYFSGDKPDPTMGALHIANAVGNGMIAFGYMAGGASPTYNAIGTLGGLNKIPVKWMIGTGAVVAAVATLALLAYGKWIKPIQEKAKYEDPWATEYLTTLGFTKDVANQIRNQDPSQGASPGPVLMQLAGKMGLDMTKPENVTKFVNYLNTLGADKIADLIEQAHRIDPNEKYEYAQTDSDSPYLGLPKDPEQTPSGNMPATVALNASTGRYEDTATGMYFDSSTKVWRAIAPKDPHSRNTIMTYDPDKGTLTYGAPATAPTKHRVEQVDVNSIEGLRYWAISEGYGVP